MRLFVGKATTPKLKENTKHAIVEIEPYLWENVMGIGTAKSVSNTILIFFNILYFIQKTNHKVQIGLP